MNGPQLPFALATTAIATSCLGTAALDTDPRSYLCYQAPHRLKIDGDLSKPEWAAALWTEDFQDIEGSGKPKPKYRTRAKMLWDDDYLYVAADIEDPHVWGTATRHDSIVYRDPDFEIFLSPVWDRTMYYEFEMNALNTTMDLLLDKPYKDGGQAVLGWDFKGLKSAVRIDGKINDSSHQTRGWTAEIAIPWTSIHEFYDVPGEKPDPSKRYRPAEGTQWRINFSRVQYQTIVENGTYAKRPGSPEDNWVWSPQGVVDMHRPERWGYVQFTRKPPGRAKFHRDPSIAAKKSLFKIYYAERQFRTVHGRWASIEELGVPAAIVGDGVEDAAVYRTPNLFEAQITAIYPDGTAHRWAISQDSRVWEIPVAHADNRSPGLSQ